jgi:signal transduction histidine kinase
MVGAPYPPIDPMKSIATFLSAEEFMPHGYCLLWRPEILWLHIVSDLAIALAYYGIPLAIFYFVRKRGDLPHESIFWLLGAFILLCGTTHLMAIWVLWYPDFVLEGLLKAATGFVSVLTLLVSIRLLPKALLIPSAAQLAALNRELESNIRQREAAQDDLQRAYSAMENTVAERTAELRKTLSELAESNAHLEQFAYVASHDLKEPLRGMNFHATALLEDYAEKLDEAGVNRLKRLTQLPAKMDALIDDLHAYARLGQGALTFQETDLGGVIREIEDALEVLIKQANAEIIVANDLPRILSDKSWMSRVFYNLIVNGIKYNDKPRPRIEIGHNETAQQSGEGTQIVFYVRDNGIGIAPQFQEKIFDLFKRLNPEDYDKKGSGMGLTFVRKIIERHGGRIWLESKPGEGTTFFFTLGRWAGQAAA